MKASSKTSTAPLRTSRSRTSIGPPPHGGEVRNMKRRYSA